MLCASDGNKRGFIKNSSSGMRHHIVRHHHSEKRV